MPTLLSITADLNAIDALLAERGGDVSDPEVSAAVAAWFAEFDANMTDKVDNYAALISELRGRAEVRKAESQRLAVLVKTDSAFADNLEERLKFAFEQRSIRKLETPRYRVTIVNNGGAVPLILDVDATDLPFEYQVLPPVVADKLKIKADLLAGKEVPGARFGDAEHGSASSDI